MKKSHPIILLALTALLVFNVQCKKEISCEGCINGNRPPVAIAGPDQTISLPANSILLDGSASNDPEGRIISWQWTKISGPSSVAVDNHNISKTLAKNLTEGIYLFELIVNDAGGLFDKDTVQITVLSPTFSGSGVYIAGQDTENNAALWKNGVVQKLTGVDGTTALSVFVSGNDIYVAGGAFNHWFGFDTTFIWMNGVSQNFDKVGGEGVTSVFVSGSDVYAAGWGEHGARLWKNGQAANLGNEAANAVFVSGSDVFVAGHERKDIYLGNNNWRQTLAAKYWKNGVPALLTDGSSGFVERALAIAVSGSDVYVAGEQAGAAMFWKNGQSTNLGAGVANALFVSGSDVYVAGQKNGVATLWKNSVAQNLGTGSANALFVSGNNVYVVGEKDGMATLWENGVSYILSGLTEANSVYIQ